MSDEPATHRFLTPTQVADELNVKPNQVHALIKAGELRALQIGGRGMWRIGRQDLEDFIADAYRRTAERIAAGELSDDGETSGGVEAGRGMKDPGLATPSSAGLSVPGSTLKL